MAEEVKKWLETKGLPQYYKMFIENGYDDIDSLGDLDNEDLDAIGITDRKHRDIIQGKCSSVASLQQEVHKKVPRPSSKSPRGSKAMESNPFDQFESMWADIDNMLEDMSSIQPETNTTNGFSNSDSSQYKASPEPSHAKAFQSQENLVSSGFSGLSGLQRTLSVDLDDSDHLELEFHPSPDEEPSEDVIGFPGRTLSSTVELGPLAKQGDYQDPGIDLDSILDDLMLFDPSKTVAQAQTKKETQPSGDAVQPTNGVHRGPQTRDGHLSHQPEVPKSQPPLPLKAEISASKSGEPVTSENTVVISKTHKLPSASDLITDDDVKIRLENFAAKLRQDPLMSPSEVELKLKEEKMRIALDKMKLANQKKVVIKVYTDDGSSKAVVLDEYMTSAMVCHLLAEKNHAEESPYWEVVEKQGDLGLERALNDHENVVDVHLHWPRENKNVFMFRKNKKKFDLLENPLLYFPTHLGTRAKDVDKQKMAERAKKIMLQEYLCPTGGVPEIEGVLYMKDGYKKPWKKYFFILRSSGLYFSTKGKSKATKHLIKFVTFEDHDLFVGVNFKKVLSAPSQFCFCLKPAKSSFAKDVKVLCAENAQSFRTWNAGIKIAKYGYVLHDNHKKAFQTQFKIEESVPPEGIATTKKMTDEISDSKPVLDNDPVIMKQPPQQSMPTKNEPAPVPFQLPKIANLEIRSEHQEPSLPPPKVLSPPTSSGQVHHRPNPATGFPNRALKEASPTEPVTEFAKSGIKLPMPTGKPLSPANPQVSQAAVGSSMSPKPVPPTMAPKPASRQGAKIPPPTAPRPSHKKPSPPLTEDDTVGTPPSQIKKKPPPAPPPRDGSQLTHKLDAEAIRREPSNSPPRSHPTQLADAHQSPPTRPLFKKPPPPVAPKRGQPLVTNQNASSIQPKPSNIPLTPSSQSVKVTVTNSLQSSPTASQPLVSQTDGASYLQKTEKMESFTKLPTVSQVVHPTRQGQPPAEPIFRQPEPPSRQPDPPLRHPDPPPRHPDPPPRQPEPPSRQPDPPLRQPDPPSRQPDPTFRHPDPPPRQPDPPSRQPVPPSRQPDPPSRQPDPPLRQPVPPPRQPEPPSRQPEPPSRQPDPTSRQPDPPPRQPDPPPRQPVPPSRYPNNAPQLPEQSPRFPNQEVTPLNLPFGEVRNSSSVVGHSHEFSNYPWFHGKISRDEAQKRLADVGLVNGVYLIRESSTVIGSYVLTMFAYGTFRNFQIQRGVLSPGNDVFFIDDGPRFTAINLLLEHYAKDADRMPCSLTRCATRP